MEKSRSFFFSDPARPISVGGVKPAFVNGIPENGSWVVSGLVAAEIRIDPGEGDRNVLETLGASFWPKG